ncbi:MAG: primosomal protein N' [Alphaproteobacteria bacterium]
MPSRSATAPAPADSAATLAVLLPLPLAGAYDYRADPALGLAPGDFVVVPLGPREVVGVVWGRGTGDVAPAKLRDVVERIDHPPLPESLLRFVAWVARWTLAPPGAVLRLALAVPGLFDPPPSRAAWTLAALPPQEMRLTDGRRRVLAAAADGLPRTTGELAREAGVGPAVVRGLAEAGALDAVELPAPLPFGEPDLHAAGPVLSAAQQAATAELVARVGERKFSTTLLDGVTGSGKTEVYFEAIAAALKDGRQVLVLVPEIALTPQWIARFEGRFAAAPAVWHSEIRGPDRAVTWRAVADGRARLVVGARSALFLPFRDLGLVVVDEEHEQAFKQEDGVPYHARDMAVVRAQIVQAPCVLVSATPSLESVVNVQRGRYREVLLPERHGGAAMPAVEAIDLRVTPPPPGRFLAPPLVAALAANKAAGGQSLLFLNRRGYAPLTLCRKCGHRFECPNCTAWLVEHRLRRQLQCHHCGFMAPVPPECPSCGATDALVACGPGVERIAEELVAVDPDLRVAVMTSDTVRGPDSVRRLVAGVEAGEVDVLLGTQMVAKGHHFPGLTLVGVVDADLGLGGGDLRAGERTFQLLHQVAGRAGRAERPGRVLLQTWQPEHPVIRAIVEGARERFMALEAQMREAGGWPPFGRLAALVVSAGTPDLADGVARRLARAAPHGEGVTVLGPAPAPLAILRGRHRRRLLLKCGRDEDVQAIVAGWLERVDIPAAVRLSVDIDPYSFV